MKPNPLKQLKTTLPSLAVLCTMLFTIACSGDDDGAMGTGDPAAVRPPGAILLAQRFSTPDGRVMYMGAFPNLPTTAVDVSQLVELGPGGDAFACGGHGFFFNSDAGTITRYLVGNDLKLTKDIAINVGLQGISGWTGAHVCASPTQAFILNESGGRIVEWNPTTMAVTSAFDVPLPEVDPTLSIQFFEPFIAGKLVYFPVGAVNWDTNATSPRAILGIFDLNDKSMTFTYDARCQTSLGGFVDSAGNFYRLPEDGGYFRKYSPTPNLPPDCVLRVPAGGKAFDPAFALPLPAPESLRAMWPVDDQHVLATILLDSQAPPPENMGDWYSLPVTPTLINLQTGARAPYASVPNVQPMNSRKLVLDGKSFYQVYTFDAEGRTTKVDLVQLTLAGAVPVFPLMGGDVLTLERLW